MGFLEWFKKGPTVGVWTAVLAWISIGLLATVTSLAIFASQNVGAWAVFATGLVIAAASMLAGGLIGFIFGVPRVLADDDSSERKPFPSGLVVGNTNLEQISDWLTKILIGIGLTQFVAISNAAQNLFDALTPSFGGEAAGKAFAGGLITYSTTFGFVTGWLYSRLLLGAAMAKADQRAYVATMLEREADQAEKEGDRQAALVLRDRAREVLHGLTDIGAAYDKARQSMPPSPTRTAEFDRLAEQAREFARMELYDPDRMKTALASGTEGERVAALATMEVRADVNDLGLKLAPLFETVAEIYPPGTWHKIADTDISVSAILRPFRTHEYAGIDPLATCENIPTSGSR